MTPEEIAFKRRQLEQIRKDYPEAAPDSEVGKIIAGLSACVGEAQAEDPRDAHIRQLEAALVAATDQIAHLTSEVQRLDSEAQRLALMHYAPTASDATTDAPATEAPAEHPAPVQEPAPAAEAPQG